jgi:hypothetical protein
VTQEPARVCPFSGKPCVQACGASDPCEIQRVYDGEGEANRIYRNGVLVGTFPPVRSPALTLVGCSFHDCGGVRP